MQQCTEQPRSEGEAMEASKAFKLHVNHETLWAHLSSSTTRSKGVCVWQYEHVRWTPCRFSPPGDTIGAEGEKQHTEETPKGAAPTSPPEGVFRHKRLMELDKLSGRTTGRL